MGLNNFKASVLSPVHTSDNVAKNGNIVAEIGDIVAKNTMLPVSATMSNEISSFRQSRNKLNMLNLLRLFRKDEISFDIVAVFGDIVASVVRL